MSILTQPNLTTRTSKLITLYGTTLSVWSIGGTYTDRGDLSETVGGTTYIAAIVYPRTVEEQTLEREGVLIRSDINGITVAGTTIKTGDRIYYQTENFKITEFGSYGFGKGSIATRFAAVKESNT